MFTHDELALMLEDMEERIICLSAAVGREGDREFPRTNRLDKWNAELAIAKSAADKIRKTLFPPLVVACQEVNNVLDERLRKMTDYLCNPDKPGATEYLDRMEDEYNNGL